MSMGTIAPKALHERIVAGESVNLIDVRTPAEFGEVHATAARSVPMDRLDPKAVRPNGDTSPVYVICRSGGRSKMACESLLRSNLGPVVNVEGGTMAWEQAGLPVIRGKKAMSLERQVRIAAGALVVLGTALGWFVHLGFFGVATFVGAGLVFAGITDTCAMGMMIAKMPWNRAAS